MARGSSEDEDEEAPLFQQAVSKALVPLYIAVSRPALKAYLSSILFVGASFLLLAVSTTAYLLFYYNYIPQVGLSQLVYLQYADGPFPHSTTYLTSSSSPSSSLSSLQPYDVTIHLHLPRTPTNLAAGNFMLDLSLMSPPSISEPGPPISAILAPSNITKILAHSRRPAILPYRSPITSLTNTCLSLPLHALSLRDIDATTLSIPMFEKVTFARGWRNLPASARLELQTQPHTQAALLGCPADPLQHIPLQVYSARIDFRARFQGLRWLMYNWRVLSFLAFTGGFYCLALLSTAIVWGSITLISPFSRAGKCEEEEHQKIKNEADVDADTKATNGHVAHKINNVSGDGEGGESGDE